MASRRSPPSRNREGPEHALHLFEACGLELEYALVDRTSHDVVPIADVVLQRGAGADRPVNDWPRGELGWSNALVMHVLELTNVRPASDLAALAKRLQDEVVAMNGALGAASARLMPGGMHPWMDPRQETRVWPHAHGEVYRAYDRIFGCRSHGWANLQSTRISLPYSGDAEFAQLHAALRAIVAILPAITAASPYLEGRATDILDQRMEVYRRNADAVPQMHGEIVPEIVTSVREYGERILEPLYAAIGPHDVDGILREDWLNARGVVPRFDRSALEIRVVDTQECPQMDVGYAALAIDLAASLCERELARPTAANQLPTRMLAEVFRRCIHDADRARIEHPEVLALFGMKRASCDAASLWSFIAERLERANAPHAAVWRAPLEFTLTRGPLARRLVRAIGPRPSRGALHELYSALCDALHAGKPFDP